LNDFCSKDELHIILKRRNLEICEHSSFLIRDEIVCLNQTWSSEIYKFAKITNILILEKIECSQVFTYEAYRTKNYLGGQILYTSLDYSKKRHPKKIIQKSKYLVRSFLSVEEFDLWILVRFSSINCKNKSGRTFSLGRFSSKYFRKIKIGRVIDFVDFAASESKTSQRHPIC